MLYTSALQAWQEAQPEIEKSKRYGTWLRDTYFSGPDDSGRWCHIAEIKCVWEITPAPFVVWGAVLQAWAVTAVQRVMSSHPPLCTAVSAAC